MDLKEEEQHSPINVHCKYMVSLSFLFRSNEGEDFSAQWRVGNFRAKVNIKSRLERKKIRSKKGAEYSTQVSSPLSLPPRSPGRITKASTSPLSTATSDGPSPSPPPERKGGETARPPKDRAAGGRAEAFREGGAKQWDGKSWCRKRTGRGGLTPMQDGGEEGGKGEWSGVQG